MRRVAMVVWEKDNVYVELEMSKSSKEEIESITRELGFPPKGAYKRI